MTARPLDGLVVIERTHTVAGAYAGRLLAMFGADTVLIEPPTGHALRTVAPILAGSQTSSIFAYLAAEKHSVVCDLDTDNGRRDARAIAKRADVYVDDFDRDDRQRAGLEVERLRREQPRLVQVSIRPFGATGPKAGWLGEEITLFHASGEGNLLPNGLADDLSPDRAPLKIFGYFAELQGGTAAALAVLTTLWFGSGEAIDISVQDAAVCVGAFAVQRYGDGAVETRHTRSFKYGGVIPCADGHVEILTLEDRQWTGLAELVGRPDWLADPRLRDGAGRGAHGAAINAHLHSWASNRCAAAIVAEAQRLGVPAAAYRSPSEVLGGEHERHRSLFQSINVPGCGLLPVLRGPFRIDRAAPELGRGVPELGTAQHLIERRDASA